jgi:cation:H+ antiporter
MATMMLLYGILFIVGLLMVLKGGSYFVDSSTAIAKRLNIPRIVIGGTIVSLATTAPELVVSTTASYLGDSGIALGNAIGSAIANIGLIVSVTAILTPIAIDVVDFRRRATWMLLLAVLVYFMSWNFQLSSLSGIILVLLAALYLFLNTLRTVRARKDKAAPEESKSLETSYASEHPIVMFLIGAVVVIVGSKLLVRSSIEIATALQIPSVIIGMTAVAIGTSVPELVTAITSARRKVADLSIGNILGANILNLSFITGTSAIINPLTVDTFTRHYAFSWLFLMILVMMAIFWQRGQMNKKAGIAMLVLYVIYNSGLLTDRPRLIKAVTSGSDKSVISKTVFEKY